MKAGRLEKPWAAPTLKRTAVAVLVVLILIIVLFDNAIIVVFEFDLYVSRQKPVWLDYAYECVY